MSTTPVRVVRLDGGGMTFCTTCKGRLDYSSWAYFSDGRRPLPYCSLHVPGVGTEIAEEGR